MEEIEEEDRCNRDVRLTVKRFVIITARNDVFNPEAFERWLSGDLGSIGEIIKAAYYNTLGF